MTHFTDDDAFKKALADNAVYSEFYTIHREQFRTFVSYYESCKRTAVAVDLPGFTEICSECFRPLLPAPEPEARKEGWFIPLDCMSGVAQNIFAQMMEVIRTGGMIDVHAYKDARKHVWQCDGLKYAVMNRPAAADEEKIKAALLHYFRDSNYPEVQAGGALSAIRPYLLAVGPQESVSSNKCHTCESPNVCNAWVSKESGITIYPICIDTVFRAPKLGWQPIETAPKDGTPLWGCWKNKNGVWQGVLYFREGYWNLQDTEEPLSDMNTVTDWMPLPDAPRLTKQESE